MTTPFAQSYHHNPVSSIRHLNAMQKLVMRQAENLTEQDRKRLESVIKTYSRLYLPE